MPITLSFGSDNDNDIPLNTLMDLATSSNTAPTLFKFAEAVIPGLNQPVANFPAASSPMTLNYQSGNNSWTLGNFTFGLSGGASGSVSVILPGQNLLSYIKTFPTTIGAGLETVTNSVTSGQITAPAGQYYVQVQLNLELTANASAKVNVGQVGIQGSASTSDTFKVTFSKAVPGATLMKDALGQAFSGFVLPLHRQTLQHLQPGDYLYHNFNATLNLGFGITLGINETYFSGQWVGAIPGSPAGTPAVNLSAEATIQADLSFGTTFQYSGTFEVMLWKPDDTHGQLHIYQSQSTDPEFTIGATVAVIANPAVNISSLSLGKLLPAVLPGSSDAVTQLLSGSAAQTQVNTWVSDAQQKIKSWLTPVQEAKAQLQIAIDDLNSRFLLIDAMFDMNQVGFPTAWANVIAGNFQAALAQTNGGMTLDSGSGLEAFHHQKTDITLNLFGLFRAEITTGTVENYSIVYAGNNTFNLVENIGLQSITNINGSGKEIDLFFAARATETVAGGLTLAPVELHVLVKATNNSKFGNAIAQFLTLGASGAVAQQLLNQLIESVKRGNTTQTLEVIFEPTAYEKLKFSQRGANGGKLQPPRNDDGNDSGNYAQFAQACWESEPGMVADTTDFSVNSKLDLTYEVWAEWNMQANGLDPNDATQYPDRANPGNPQAALSFLDQQFNSPATLLLIPNVLDQASRFMNFVQSLVELSTLPGGNAGNWNDLTNQLGAIIHAAVTADYVVPAGYALTELVRENGDAQPSILGPTPNAAGEPSIAIVLTYS